MYAYLPTVYYILCTYRGKVIMLKAKTALKVPSCYKLLITQLCVSTVCCSTGLVMMKTRGIT